MSVMREMNNVLISSSGSENLRCAQRQLLRNKSVGEMRQTNLNRRLHVSSHRAQCLSSLFVQDHKPFVTGRPVL